MLAGSSREGRRFSERRSSGPLPSRRRVRPRVEQELDDVCGFSTEALRALPRSIDRDIHSTGKWRQAACRPMEASLATNQQANGVDLFVLDGRVQRIPRTSAAPVDVGAIVRRSGDPLNVVLEGRLIKLSFTSPSG
jgi:hypothetical protein